MRVVVFGASGNVGTSVLEVLGGEPRVERIIAVARRAPTLTMPKVEWARADIVGDDLVAHLEGADAAIHLAWAIQPSRDPAALRSVNIDGSLRVFDAIARARVPVLLYASSVGAYSRGPKDRRVDESWPTEGVESSFYSRHKAEVERALDEFERGEPGVRVVRMRPGLIFKREAATEIRRLFLGPLLPRFVADPRLIPLVPRIARLCFQAVHSHDVGEAFRLALLNEDARGAYNLAAEPVLGPVELGELLDARPVGTRAGILRAGAQGTWLARLQPTPPGWLDMALAVPLMSSARARSELGWSPQRGADESLLELLAGLRDGAGFDTPPLDPGSGGPFRWREFATGVGARAF
jgi:UDP-glucose 4-epimerase